MASKTPRKPPAPEGAAAPPPAAANPPPKLRLGCAPLIVGVVLVALLGKFLPHETRRTPAAMPAATPRDSKAEVKPARPEPRPQKPVPPKTAEVPRKPDTPPKTGPAAVKAQPAAPERPAVANSPWNGSVRQVERYLKNSLYDAASFEAIEWSPVVETKKGYQVRCKYRSKNVLGVYVTQSKTFFLDRGGEVYAVKE
ncbi:hypothetical protein SAMN02949497_2980 [Methylomagnum ishizawai]|uniref:Uncharacterized protein n=1 Tax=Methylomagnum ishizawai TaxID=1760988 RepID=A0A1Y6D6W0_9GAMM|nr:hypothetical protein [Methylomagnum ishizawai]SMF95615.1 hypothetical protein SAMN02949497_2980 [Methylomagnum ishizawai]